MAVKMQEKFGEDLNTIFVESQGHTMDDVRKLALDRKWLGTNAMWTRERPMTTGAKGIPNFVLLSPEGEVVMMGSPMALHGKVEDYVADSKRQRTKAPDDLHKDLKGVYKDYAKGKFADALADAKKVEAKAADDQELAEATKKMVAQITEATERGLARVDRAIEEGYYSYARLRLKELAKSLKGSEFEKQVAERESKLDGDELAAEIDAEKALAKIESGLYAKGAVPATKKLLERLVEKHSGTKAAARATELANCLE